MSENCWRCGAPLSGYKGWIPMSLCPACERVKQQEEERERQEREARDRKIQEERQREREEREREREEREREWAEREREHRAEEARRSAEEHAIALEDLERERIEAVNAQTDAMKQQAEQHHAQMLKQQKELDDRKFAFLQEDAAFEKAKPHCKWCGKKYQFNQNEGFFEYCSKKCAADDLGRDKLESYIVSASSIMEKLIVNSIQEGKNLTAIVLSESQAELSDELTIRLIDLLNTEKNHNIDCSRRDQMMKKLVSRGCIEAIKTYIKTGKQENSKNS